MARRRLSWLLIDQALEFGSVFVGDLVHEFGGKAGELRLDIFRGFRLDAVGVRVGVEERRQLHLVDRLPERLPARVPHRLLGAALARYRICITLVVLLTRYSRAGCSANMIKPQEELASCQN